MSNTAKVLVSAVALAASLAAVVIVGVQAKHTADSTEVQFRQLVALSNQGSTNPGLSTKANISQPTAQPRPTVSSEEVQKLGLSLFTQGNPQTRSDAAATFGRLASQANANSIEPGPQESKMVDLLQAAYSQERESAVRCAIVTNAAAFNHEAAARLIANAQGDIDPSVRQAAQAAAKARENRLVLAGAQEFPARSWK